MQLLNQLPLPALLFIVIKWQQWLTAAGESVPDLLLSVGIIKLTNIVLLWRNGRKEILMKSTLSGNTMRRHCCTAMRLIEIFVHHRSQFVTVTSLFSSGYDGKQVCGKLEAGGWCWFHRPSWNKIRLGLDTIRDTSGHARKLSPHNSLPVSVQSSKFNFIAHTVDKRTFMRGGVQIGQVFFPLLTSHHRDHGSFKLNDLDRYKPSFFTCYTLRTFLAVDGWIEAINIHCELQYLWFFSISFLLIWAPLRMGRQEGCTQVKPNRAKNKNKHWVAVALNLSPLLCSVILVLNVHNALLECCFMVGLAGNGGPFRDPTFLQLFDVIAVSHSSAAPEQAVQNYSWSFGGNGTIEYPFDRLPTTGAV